MGSKSSSGSLMKSVESMLPKNMNMKHVLLAVLVGLLLCMLMGQSIEGFTCTVTGDVSAYTNVDPTRPLEVGSGSTLPGNVRCAPGYTGNPAVTCPGGTGTPARLTGCTATAATPAPAPAPAGSTAHCGAATAALARNQGPYNTQSRSAECGEYCNYPTVTGGQPQANWADPIKTGYCTGGSNGAPALMNICAMKQTEGDCNNPEGEMSGCSWVPANPSDEPLEFTEQWYDHILILAGVLKSGCKTRIPGKLESSPTSHDLNRSQVTEPLELKFGGPSDTGAEHNASAVVGIADTAYEQARADQKNSWDGLKKPGSSGAAEDKYYDFLHLLDPNIDNNKPANAHDVSSKSLAKSSNKIPQKYLAILQTAVSKAEASWKGSEKILARNGGRVIFGYSKRAGFVFRNPPGIRECAQLPIAQFHVGFPCPNTWDSANTRIVPSAEDYSCKKSDTDCSIVKQNIDDIPPLDRLTALFGLGLCDVEQCKALDICTTRRTADNAARMLKSTIGGFFGQ